MISSRALSGSPPTIAPFFPEVHDELTKSWSAPYSSRICPSASAALTSVDGAEEKGYKHLPPLDEFVATHLCPPTAIGWKTRGSHPPSRAEPHLHSLDVSTTPTPCHAGRGLAGHPQCVNVGNDYGKTRFGLSLAPRTFTRCMDAAFSPLRQMGIRILNYLDDWLILA